MTTFARYTKDMERAGIYSLWVSLGADKEGNRLMHVSPDATTPAEAGAQFPTRTFSIGGVCPIVDDATMHIAMTDDAAEHEKIIEEASAKHPRIGIELAQWMKDWKAIEHLAPEDFNEPLSADDERRIERHVKNMQFALNAFNTGRECRPRSLSLSLSPEIVAKVVDKVFGGAIEDESCIHAIHAAIIDASEQS